MAGKHRTKTPPPAVSMWLGAGAVALGVGAALTAGAGMASADTGDTGGPKSSSQSDSASAGPRSPSASSTAKRTTPRGVASVRTHRTEALRSDPVEDDPTASTRTRPTASPSAARATAATAFNPFAALEKEFRKAFVNTAPTIAEASGPTRNSDGSFSGQIVGTDVDDDPLRYGVFQAPTRGAVAIDPAGNYTYTPDAGPWDPGATVSFNLYVEEANMGSHLHGLTEFTNRLFDPLFQLMNRLVPQNRYQFPKYHAHTYARTYRYVTVTIPT